ncbi:MAG: gfo/Idh/MocA family oxidoreductase, partial [Verrucomicrobiia bacterium]
ALEWHQEHPNELILKFPNQPCQILRRGHDYLSDEAKRFTRLPPGHPEAFIEAFANIYLEAARAITDQKEARPPSLPYDFPNVDDGVAGMAFIQTAVQSAASQAKWEPMIRP